MYYNNNTNRAQISFFSKNCAKIDRISYFAAPDAQAFSFKYIFFLLNQILLDFQLVPLPYFSF